MKRFWVMLVLALVAIGATTPTSFSPVWRSVMVDTNGNVLFGTNAAQDHAFQRGGSNMVVLRTNRTEVYQPWYFALSAQEVSAYGVEKLGNTGMEITNSMSVASNWNQSVNFGGVTLSTNAHGGTNSLCIVNADVNSVLFSGDDYVLGGTNESYAYATFAYRKGSVEFWIKLNALPAVKGTVFEKMDKLNLARYVRLNVLASGKLELQMSQSGGLQAVESTYPLTVGNWVHVAVTFDLLSKDVKWYVNGVGTTKTFTFNDGIEMSDSHYVIGYSTNQTNYGLSGNLAELRIWEHVRNDAQVLTNYLTRMSGSETGLVHCWPMTEGSGTIVGDSVAASADGAFGSGTNAPAWGTTSLYVNSDSVSVTETNAVLSFYSYGDGSTPGRYGVYEPVLGTWLLSVRPISSSAASWSLTEEAFSIPAGATYAQVVLYGPTAGTVYFDDVSVKYVTLETNIWALAANCLARIGDDLFYGGKLLLQAYHLGINTTNWTNWDGHMAGGSLSNVVINGGSLTNSTVGTSNLFLLGTTNTGITHYDGTNGLQVSLTPMSYVTNSPFKWISHTLYVSNIVVSNFIQVPTLEATNVYANTMRATNVFGTNIVGSVGQFTNNVQAYSVFFTNASGATLGATTVNATDVNASTVDGSTSMQAPTGTFTNLGSTTITATTVNSTTVNATTMNGTNGTFSGSLQASRLYPLLSSNAPGASYEVSHIPGAGVAVTSNLWWGLPHRWTSNSMGFGPYAGFGFTNEGNVSIGYNAGVGSNAFAIRRPSGHGTNFLAWATNMTFNDEIKTKGTFEIWAVHTNDWHLATDYVVDLFTLTNANTWNEYIRFAYASVGTTIGPYIFYRDASGYTNHLFASGHSVSDLPNQWNYYNVSWTVVGGSLYLNATMNGTTFATAILGTNFVGWTSSTNISAVFADRDDAYAIKGMRFWSTNHDVTVLNNNKYNYIDRNSNFESIDKLDHSYSFVGYSGNQVFDEGVYNSPLTANNLVSDAEIIGVEDIMGYANYGYTHWYQQMQPRHGMFVGRNSHATAEGLTNVAAIGFDASVGEDNLMSLGSAEVPMNLKISGLNTNELVWTDALKRLQSIPFDYLSNWMWTNYSVNITNIYNQTNITYYEGTNYITTNYYSVTNEYAVTNLYSVTNEYALTNQYYLTNLYSLTNQYSLTNEYSLTNSYSITNEYALTNQYYLTNLYSLTNEYSLTNQYALTNYYNTTNVYNVTNESGLAGAGTPDTIPVWMTDTQLGDSPLTWAAGASYITNSVGHKVDSSASINLFWAANGSTNRFRVSQGEVLIGPDSVLRFERSTNNVTPVIAGYVEVAIGSSGGTMYLPVYQVP